MSSQFLRLIPTYGNWGGPGWSGGKRIENYSEVDWDVPPVDSLDALFYVHDWGYKLSNGRQDVKKVDAILLRQMKQLPEDPDDWDSPPMSRRYAMLYRTMAVWAFKFLTLVRSKLPWWT